MILRRARCIEVGLLLAAIGSVHAEQCATFLPMLERSRCAQQADALFWKNQPDGGEPVALPKDAWDEQLTDPALLRAVPMQGQAEFRFSGKGAYVLEVFLAERAERPSSFVLLAGGAVADARQEILPGPERLRPGGRNRYLNLVATVEGPTTLTIATPSRAWGLVGLRWTERQEFETFRVAALRRQLKRRLSEPFFGIGERGASLRAAHIEQLGLRLVESRNLAARREGLHAQARAMYWRAAENHEPREVQRAAALIEELLRTNPDDPLIRQMASAGCLRQNTPREQIGGRYCAALEPVPWSIELPASPDAAPAWAANQRRLMHRTEAITRWWVEKRQRENGELGGGWGDDVEILRQWGPLALGFGSEVAARGIRRLADGIWRSDEMLDGYSRSVSDVEHSSEPATDTQPLRAALDPGDHEVRRRLAATAACAYNWIAPGTDGHWRFQSSWFNCRTLDRSRARALDVHLNTRAIGPALWHAYLTRDPKLIELLASWGASWRHAQQQTAHGKPAGAFPPVLDAQTGDYLIRSQDWAKPQAEWDYFQWSAGAQMSLVALMSALHDLTGQEDWLQAARQGATLAAGPSSASPARTPLPSRPDEVLALMAREGEEAERRLGVNFEMFTSEALWTDRVYYPLPENYRWALFGGEAPRGDRYPNFAVTWGAAAGDVARAVLEAKPDQVALALYNFEPAAVEVPLRLWRLRPGRYQVRGLPGGPAPFVAGQLPHDLKLTIPPRKEVRVVIGFENQ
jgi:hypothetical protein